MGFGVDLCGTSKEGRKQGSKEGKKERRDGKLQNLGLYQTGNSLHLPLLPINFFFFYLDKMKNIEQLNPEVKRPGNQLF